MRGLIFNLLASLYQYCPIQSERLEGWIVDGCEKWSAQEEPYF